MTDPLGLVSALAALEATRSAKAKPNALSVAVGAVLARARLAGAVVTRWVACEIVDEVPRFDADGPIELARWALALCLSSEEHASVIEAGEGQPVTVEHPDGRCAPEALPFVERLLLSPNARAVLEHEVCLEVTRGMREASAAGFRRAEVEASQQFAARKKHSPPITVPGWRVGFEYRTRRDNRVRRGRPEDHGENHKAMDGIRAPHDDPVWSSFSPPLGFNCFPGDTVVQGRILLASRILYTGEMIEILTEGARRLTLTPHHRVATSAGMVESGSLKPGDQVLRYSWQNNGLPLKATAKLHEEHEPAAVEEVFRALLERGHVTRLHRGAHDLHGDSIFGQGEIEVVAVNRELLLQVEAQHRQRVVQPVLVGDPGDAATQAAQVEGASGLGERGGVSLASRRSGPSAGALALDDRAVIGIGLALRPLERLCLGAASRHNSPIYEPLADRAARETEGICDSLLRLTGEVAADNIVAVERKRFTATHVYDLQTETGWIVANDTFISNCRCVIVPTRPPPKWTDDALATALERGAAGAPGFGGK